MIGKWELQHIMARKMYFNPTRINKYLRQEVPYVEYDKK